MPDSLAGTTAGSHPTPPAVVVLAAGVGSRLAPLTLERPKALCPVGGVPLVDLALRRVGGLSDRVAVNIHHRREQLEEHLALVHPWVHRSVEEPGALGTAGALGRLRNWIDGRAVVTINADAWTTADLGPLLVDWDGRGPRLLVAGRGGFGRRMQVVASLLPWSDVRSVSDEPAGLYERCWRGAQAEGRMEVIVSDAPFVDCGTTTDYLRANLAAVAVAGASVVDETAAVGGQAHRSVVGRGSRVDGRVERSVVWDDAVVTAGERLVDAIRTTMGRTVLVR